MQLNFSPSKLGKSMKKSEKYFLAKFLNVKQQPLHMLLLLASGLLTITITTMENFVKHMLRFIKKVAGIDFL
jgi:hypothetical protein